VPTEECVIHHANHLELKDFPRTAKILYEEHSYDCGAVKVVLPIEMLTNDQLLSPTVLGVAKPLLQTYEKKTEGVYNCANITMTKPVSMPNFMTRNVKPSLKKSGASTYNDEKRPFWNSSYKQYEKFFKTKQFSEYVVDYNGTLFADPDHPWLVALFFLVQFNFTYICIFFSRFQLTQSSFLNLIFIGVWPSYVPLSPPISTTLKLAFSVSTAARLLLALPKVTPESMSKTSI
jgi:hypothetical protein